MEKKSKTMQVNPTTKQPEKLTYEQLENVARDLNMQNRQLQAQLENAGRVISEFNDLGMLLNIVKQGECFSPEFIVRCTDRIEKLVNSALDNYDELEAQKEAQKEK